MGTRIELEGIIPSACQFRKFRGRNLFLKEGGGGGGGGGGERIVTPRNIP